MAPHVNVEGPAGAGKTSVVLGLAEKFETVVIPNVATRFVRPGEEGSPEYNFIDLVGLAQQIERGADVLIGATAEDHKDDPDVIRIGEVILKPSRQKKLLDLSGILIPTLHGVPADHGEKIKGNWHPKNWPKAGPTTELVASAFGEWSWEIKKDYAPDMINIFVTCRKTRTITERLRRRCKGEDDFRSKRLYNINYLRQRPWEKYDYVVFNEDGELEKCIAEIAEIAGLPPR